jgi:hypothetical protein
VSRDVWLWVVAAKVQLVDHTTVASSLLPLPCRQRVHALGVPAPLEGRTRHGQHLCTVLRVREWFTEHKVEDDVDRLELWLEYMMALNILQF